MIPSDTMRDGWTSPMTDREPKSFAEFWPTYVLAHGKFSTQLIHVVGTLAAVAFAVYLIVTAQWLWLPLAPVIGYGPAFLSHFTIEGNRPLSFGNPVYSFAADFKMVGYFLNGRMRAEIERCRRQG
jgi:hypothetical protein